MSIFQKLVRLVAPYIIKSPAVPETYNVGKKFAVTLRYLATGNQLQNKPINNWKNNPRNITNVVGRAFKVYQSPTDTVSECCYSE